MFGYFTDSSQGIRCESFGPEQAQICREKNAFMLFITVLIALAVHFIPSHEGIKNGFVSMTMPHSGLLAHNPATGYSASLYHGTPYMIENRSILEDLAMFAGIRPNTSFYAARPGGGVMASLIPAYDPALAPLVRNAILIALVCAAFYSLCRKVGFGCETSALFALCYVTFGIYGFHAGDRSAHLPGAALAALNCIVACRVLGSSGEPSNRSVLALSALCWFSTQTYYFNCALFAGLFFALFKNRRQMLIVLCCAVACYAHMRLYDNYVSMIFATKISYFETEHIIVNDFIARMHNLFNMQWLYDFIKQFVISEMLSPLFLLLYVILLVYHYKNIINNIRIHIFLIAALAANLICCFPVMGFTARGYVSYFIPICCFTGLMLLLYNVNKRYLNIFLLFCCIWQVLALYSYRIGNPVAISNFFTGYKHIFTENNLLILYISYIKQYLFPYTYIFDGNKISYCSFIEFADIIKQSYKMVIPYLGQYVVGFHDFKLYRAFLANIYVVAPLICFVSLYFQKYNFLRSLIIVLILFGVIFTVSYNLKKPNSMQFHHMLAFIPQNYGQSQRIDSLEFSFVLPSELLAYAEKSRYDHFSVHAGTRLWPHEFDADLLVNEKHCDPLTSSNPVNGNFAKYALPKVQDRNVNVRLVETYKKPLAYFWVRPAFPDGAILTGNLVGGKESPLLPFLEVRFYRKGWKVPGATFFPRYDVKANP